MTPERIRSRFARLAAVALLVATPLAADAKPTTPEAPAATAPSAETEGQIQADAYEAFEKRRLALLDEARAALDDTHAALTALENEDAQKALDALAHATGRLELVLARDPQLALAPIDVDVVTYDLYTTVEAVNAARDRAKELLDEGRVQDARLLLSDLASETVISVTNLPLATYPQAIKEISPLVDAGRLDEAKNALRAALDTLVVTRQVIALPIARAVHMLDEAQSLLDAEDDASAEPADAETADDVPAKIEKLVDGARYQLEIAEALGYGRDADHRELRGQIAELEKKIGAEQATEGVFARLRRSLESLQRSFGE